MATSNEPEDIPALWDQFRNKDEYRVEVEIQKVVADTDTIPIWIIARALTTLLGGMLSSTDPMQPTNTLHFLDHASGLWFEIRWGKESPEQWTAP